MNVLPSRMAGHAVGRSNRLEPALSEKHMLRFVGIAISKPPASKKTGCTDWLEPVEVGSLRLLSQPPTLRTWEHFQVSTKKVIRK